MLKPIKCIECGAVDLSLFECITHLFFCFFNKILPKVGIYQTHVCVMERLNPINASINHEFKLLLLWSSRYFFFILMEQQNKKELRINQSLYPSDTHCVVQHSIMRITFTISPLWLSVDALDLYTMCRTCNSSYRYYYFLSHSMVSVLYVYAAIGWV